MNAYIAHIGIEDTPSDNLELITRRLNLSQTQTQRHEKTNNLSTGDPVTLANESYLTAHLNVKMLAILSRNHMDM